MDWYYYDTNNEKIGPISASQLKQLAAQGSITPETIIENTNGRTAVAGKVGLVFPKASEVPLAEVYELATPTPPVEPNPFTAAPISPAQPVQVPSSTPQQFFCTNCGNAVSEQAVACMSCGAAPTGHKKFCRQCGIGLNSEQVVCGKCGTVVNTKSQDSMKNLSAALEPKVKQMVQVIKSSPIIEKIKNLPKWILITGCLLLLIIGGLMASSSTARRDYYAKVNQLKAELRRVEQENEIEIAKVTARRSEQRKRVTGEAELKYFDAVTEAELVSLRVVVPNAREIYELELKKAALEYNSTVSTNYNYLYFNDLCYCDQRILQFSMACLVLLSQQVERKQLYWI